MCRLGYNPPCERHLIKVLLVAPACSLVRTCHGSTCTLCLNRSPASVSKSASRICDDRPFDMYGSGRYLRQRCADAADVMVVHVRRPRSGLLLATHAAGRKPGPSLAMRSRLSQHLHTTMALVVNTKPAPHLPSVPKVGYICSSPS